MRMRLGCLAMLLVAAPAWAQSPSPTPALILLRPAAAPEPALKYKLLPRTELSDGNAAPLYYRAVILKGRDLPEEQLNRINDWIKAPLDKLPRDEVRTLLKDHQKSFDELTLAVRRQRCDWGVDLGDGTDYMGLLLPELQPIFQLGKLMILDARLAIAEGRSDRAIEALQIGFGIARHLGQAPYLIHGLVANALARHLEQQLRDWIQQPGAPNLYWALASLPVSFLDLSRPMQIEKEFPYRMFPLLREVHGKPLGMERSQDVAKILDRVAAIIVGEMKANGASEEAAASKLKEVRAAITTVSPAARKFLIAQGRTAAEVDALPVPQAVAIYSLHTYQRLSDDLIKWMNLPYWQAHEGLRRAMANLELAKQTNAGAPFPITIAAFVKVSRSMATSQRTFAALRVVEAIRLHAAASGGKLPAALAEITAVPVPHDPLLGRPFEYKAAGDKATLFGGPPPGEDVSGMTLQYELALMR